MLNIPNRLKSYLLKFMLCLALLMLCRLLFYFFNYSYFSVPDLSVFLGGLRFDLATLGFLLLPLLFLHLLFFIPWYNKVYQTTLHFFFYLPVAIIIILNSIDFEYFKFTFKRSSSDLFHLLFLSNDIEDQSIQILFNHWYILLIAVLLCAPVVFFYNRIHFENKKPVWQAWLLWAPVFVLLMVVSARGGFQLKPLDVIHAGSYSSAQNIPIVLNTPFTFLKSIGKDQLHIVEYYSEDQLKKIYSPVKQFNADGPQKNLNVVIIILEGFSSEYIGYFNNYKGYTPFLDSLFEESLVFTNAFANGKKSIESLPAILSGIPSLSTNPYISSGYSGNKIMSLPQVLEEYNYSTSFYHGGANGTMGFDAFSRMAGIDEYYGLKEYPRAEVDYDGNWGIFDEPYLQYFNMELETKKQPFFSSVFTLSSHHPYTIPEDYQGNFPKGSLSIHESIGYADYALKLFFDAAKKSDYYKNTLFVLVADHTAQTDQEAYQSRSGMFRVPLAFHYNGKIKGESDIIAQQSDIFPSVIDFLNVESKIISFGNSLFDPNADHFSVNYLNGIYEYIEGDYSLLFDGETSISLSNIHAFQKNTNNLLEKKPELALAMERKLKAIIQQYNNRLIRNQLSVK